jgi:hypothetical protein
MKHEFEQIAGYKVSQETYSNIIEPMYLATNLSKQEFAKTLSRKALEEPKEEPKTVIIGVRQMPNGTWMTYLAEIKNINIKTGKIEVKRLSANRCWAEISYDYNAFRVEEIA